MSSERIPHGHCEGEVLGGKNKMVKLEHRGRWCLNVEDEGRFFVTSWLNENKNKIDLSQALIEHFQTQDQNKN